MSHTPQEFAAARARVWRLTQELNTAVDDFDAMIDACKHEADPDSLNSAGSEASVVCRFCGTLGCPLGEEVT